MSGAILLAALAALQKPERLLPDQPRKGTVATDLADAAGVRLFRLTVPADALRVELSLGGEADVNLYVSTEPVGDVLAERRRALAAGEEPADPAEDERIVAWSAATTASERVVLDRAALPALATGDYYAAVAFERDRPPRRADGGDLAAVSFTLSLKLHRARVDGELALGRPASGAVDPAAGGFRTYTVKVPADAPVLRLDLTGAPADLNLRARRGKATIDPADADASAETLVGTEVLLVEPTADAPIEGIWYVDVVDPSFLEWKVPFTLRASTRREPDPELLALPVPPAPRTPLERAVAATVELVGPEGAATGLLISDRGWILTNHHVVEEEVEQNGRLGERFIVGLTFDPRDPPRELFRARVVASDKELDLALLKCETGFYGQPIPEGYRFPAAAFGSPEALGLGDPLCVLGFPALGSVSSRVSITLTRGVVAGFERRGDALHLKTDAQINPGNSGGPVCNGSHEVVGIATEIVFDQAQSSGQIGYLRPLWLVPKGWWEQAGVAPPGR